LADRTGRRYPVARVGEIPDGGRKIIDLEGRSVGVFRVGDEYFAVRNRCPHEGGPLCLGPTTGAVVASDPGTYEWSRAGEILRCPWHGWEFDLRTGASWFDPERVRTRRYAVTVEAGDAVDEPRAELYAVSVDDEYVVVDLGR
jgi:3-phenylpropionate/trans-cinnamate dioxygenase ferredoxin subunit